MKSKRLILFFIIMALATGCARFRIKELSPETIFKIPINGKLSGLAYPNQNGIYFEIPSRIGVSGSRLVVSEPSNKMIKIFDDGNLSALIVGPEVTVTNEEVKAAGGPERPVSLFVNQHLSIPGMIAVGNDDDFYALSYVLSGVEAGVGYYRVLHFDIKGNFINLIGRSMQKDLPFDSVLWMDTDEENNLWVLYRYSGGIQLDRYGEDEKSVSYSSEDCINAVIGEGPKQENHFYSCEVMYPFYEGDRALMVGKVEEVFMENKVQNRRFSHRVYKTRDVASGSDETVFDKYSDMDSYPYLPAGDNIFVWKTVGNRRIRFAVYDTEGDLLHNLQMELYGRQTSWRTTYSTLAGDIYSININNRSFDVIHWR